MPLSSGGDMLAWFRGAPGLGATFYFSPFGEPGHPVSGTLTDSVR